MNIQIKLKHFCWEEKQEKREHRLQGNYFFSYLGRQLVICIVPRYTGSVYLHVSLRESTSEMEL